MSTEPASDRSSRTCVKHGLVDQVAGQVGVPDGRADRLIAVGGVDQA